MAGRATRSSLSARRLGGPGRPEGLHVALVARVGSTALRKGMHSGNRAWFYVAAAATGFRLLHKYVGRTEDILTLKLKPGEAFEIREIRRAKRPVAWTR